MNKCLLTELVHNGILPMKPTRIKSHKAELRQNNNVPTMWVFSERMFSPPVYLVYMRASDKIYLSTWHLYKQTSVPDCHGGDKQYCRYQRSRFLECLIRFPLVTQRHVAVIIRRVGKLRSPWSAGKWHFFFFLVSIRYYLVHTSYYLVCTR